MFSCAHYDYIEIACMQAYPVTLFLISGETISGDALDTCRNGQQQECIKLGTTQGEVCVVLEDIKKMRVDKINPHFQEVVFQTLNAKTD
ncbi:MAG: Rho-binding antiterminator [Oceanospirillaceae bacterium]|nr:Rho-binding antiterminator [Oceanospirillaceae bacterium]MCP5335161.1 Rho-binding antiterminator [Oceanospirillaceae bacterium]